MSWSSSTYNWYWLVDGLQDAGLHVHLANTAAIKQYDGLKHSGDETDARHLAHLLRLGILPTGTILPREHRAVRDLARKRMQLVHSRTTHVLAVENIMARQLGGRMTSNQIKRLTAAAIDKLPLAADVGLAIKTNVAVIATLQAQIEVVEKRLQERVKPRPQYALLTSAPGIGETLATVILLETGPIDRFAEVGNFASYARCVDSVRRSNRKKKGKAVEAPHAPAVVPESMMPKAARERSVSFRARAPHSLRFREYPRPKASLDERDWRFVTEPVTDVTLMSPPK